MGPPSQLRCSLLVDNKRGIAAAAERLEREGWPLLIVETEANGDCKSTRHRKKVSDFFIPSRDVANETRPGRE